MLPQCCQCNASRQMHCSKDSSRLALSLLAGGVFFIWFPISSVPPCLSLVVLLWILVAAVSSVWFIPGQPYAIFQGLLEWRWQCLLRCCVAVFHVASVVDSSSELHFSFWCEILPSSLMWMVCLQMCHLGNSCFTLPYPSLLFSPLRVEPPYDDIYCFLPWPWDKTKWHVKQPKPSSPPPSLHIWWCLWGVVTNLQC